MGPGPRTTELQARRMYASIVLFSCNYARAGRRGWVGGVVLFCLGVSERARSRLEWMLEEVVRSDEKKKRHKH